MADMIRVDFESLRAARRKYRQLVRQIEEGKRPHSDLIHPAYKLGCTSAAAVRRSGRRGGTRASTLSRVRAPASLL